MNAIDRDTLLRLAARQDWPSASIYLPTDHTGIHTDADRIRLRNLAKKACERLVVDGLREPAADAMMAATQAVIADDTAWAGGPSGLAIFATPESTEVLWLDATMPETFVVGDRFYTRPLYAAYTGEKKAWALALDTNKTRLFHIDRSRDRGGRASPTARRSRWPTRLAVRRARGVAAVPHGARRHAPGRLSGLERRDVPRPRGQQGRRQDAARALHVRPDAGVVSETIGAESAEPLVLLGVDNLLDEFRARAAYAHIASERVDGATDYLSPADVQRAAVWRARAALAARPRPTSTSTSLSPAPGGPRPTPPRSSRRPPQGASRRSSWTTRRALGASSTAPRSTSRTCARSAALPSRHAGGPEGADIFECGWDLIDLAGRDAPPRRRRARLPRRGRPVSGAVAVFRY